MRYCPFKQWSRRGVLTLKAPITTAADDIHKYFFHCFSEKISLDVSSESSARQRIHMKKQALFSSKDKSKKLKCRLLQFWFGTLRIKDNSEITFLVSQENICFNPSLELLQQSSSNEISHFLCFDPILELS